MRCHTRERYDIHSWVDRYRTGSGPGSPRGQPAWGGGSDRIEHSAGLGLATLFTPLGVLC